MAPKHVDRRMFLARNASRSNDTEFVQMDIEVYGEANFVGLWENEWCKLEIWEVGHRLTEGAQKRLLFSWKEFPDNNPEPPMHSKGAFYHGGTIPEEFIYCVSLILRRRLKLGRFMRRNGKPVIAVTDRKWKNPSVVEGKTNLRDIGSWIDMVINLPEKLHQRIILAIKFYWRALRDIENSPDIAYLNLISSIEVLSSDFEIQKPTVKEINKDLANLLNRIESESLKSEIEIAIINKERFVSRKFIQFILDHVEYDFWERPNRPPCGLVEPNELKDFLKRIYNQRSKTLHEGAQFPWSAFRSNDGVEVFGRNGVGSGAKKWGQNEIIPTVGFFEELVNHVIRNYVSANTEHGS